MPAWRVAISHVRHLLRNRSEEILTRATRLHHLSADLCKSPRSKHLRHDLTRREIVVESNVIILTGSAPTLRPLWQKPQAQHYVYEDYGRTPSAGVQRYGHHSVVRTRDGDSKVADIKREKALGDGTSEEYILEDRPPNAIVRMTHVNVTYDNSKLDDEVVEQRVQPRGW